MLTMKVILGLAATWGVPAKYEDISNAYVKADKEEHLEILLRVPSGMQIKDERLKALGADSASDIALELKKSLYGLKQAGRLWSQLLQTNSSTQVTATTTAAVDCFFVAMESLSIKKLVQVSKFLRIRVKAIDSSAYALDQEEEINELLRENGLTSANSTLTSISDDCYNEATSDSILFTKIVGPGRPTIKSLQSLVGSLLWVSRCTRPDIAIAVHKATRYTHEPREQYWKLVKKNCALPRRDQEYAS
ncbi:unnamed protein product [Peronospora effusa]|nr:unnamed protein product [Peronospora effusa]